MQLCDTQGALRKCYRRLGARTSVRCKLLFRILRMANTDADATNATNRPLAFRRAPDLASSFVSDSAGGASSYSYGASARAHNNASTPMPMRFWSIVRTHGPVERAMRDVIAYEVCIIHAMRRHLAPILYAQVLGLPLTCRYCQGVPSGHALAGVPSLSQGYDCACLHARTVSFLYR